jgi:hypothetical protein
MIPYDDLVAALAAWRARQGLPTGHIAAPVAAPAPAAAPKQAADKRPASQPGRATSPAAVIGESTGETSIDVDEAALLEESSDFAMSFDSGGAGEATPPRGTPAPRRGR